LLATRDLLAPTAKIGETAEVGRIIRDRPGLIFPISRRRLAWRRGYLVGFIRRGLARRDFLFRTRAG
jgi:hypothetical protein